MQNLVIMKNRQAVTSSLQVAESFDKRHDHVLRDIDNLKGIPNFGEAQEGVQNWTDLFWEDSYTHPQNKQEYRMIYMNRDGFTLLAMGFNGKKALTFKLKYIEAFNKMEAEIRSSQIDTSNLSPELQMFNGLFNAIAKQELATKAIDAKVDNISEIVSLNSIDWKKDTNQLINKIAKRRGGFEAYRDVRNEIYEELERRAKVSLKTRLTNKRRRMADEGVAKSKRDKLTKVDVISDDKKLIEIYLAVVKDFAIKQGVHNKIELEVC